jgi:hypothetical protein
MQPPYTIGLCVSVLQLLVHHHRCSAMTMSGSSIGSTRHPPSQLTRAATTLCTFLACLAPRRPHLSSQRRPQQ